MAMSDRVQSVDRAFGLLEHMADAGGSVALSQLATMFRTAAPDDPPVGPLAGQPGVRAPGAVPAVRPGTRVDQARRVGEPDARVMGGALPLRAGRQDR